MKNSIQDIRLDFSDLMEAFARGEGLSPNSGRILGYLLMSEDPVPFSELAQELDISRGGISENTRVLEDHGIIERHRASGDRRDHFRIREDASEALEERRRERARENLRRLMNFRSNWVLSPEQEDRVSGLQSHLETLTNTPSKANGPDKDHEE